MEVILTEDVKNLGLKGEVVDVADGYARNYLLPQQMVVRATSANRERFERNPEEIEQKKEEMVDEARDLADALGTLELKIEKAASEEGSLYGSVSQDDIVDALDREGFEQIKPNQVIIDEAIKEIDEYEVRVNLAGSVEAQVSVEVVAE
ncbi:MAG: 50S ribosomal protein L9 [bacterium]